MVETAIRNSLIRNRARRRNSATSTRRTAAYTTTAPRAATGKLASTGSASSIASTVATAVTTLASWVRPPTASLIAVRLPLLLTGNPCSRPDPTLAALSARSSRLGSIRSLRRSANARPVSTLSV